LAAAIREAVENKERYDLLRKNCSLRGKEILEVKEYAEILISHYRAIGEGKA
jgi:hypothetical protein